MKKTIYIVALAALLFSCKETKTEETAPKNDGLIDVTEAQFQSIGMQIENPKEQPFDVSVKTSGTIDVPPQNLVSVSMPLGGYLKSTKLLPGMHVSKNEVIAVMEDQQYIQLQQEYLTTQSKLYFAEKEYERQRDLNQNKASSDKVYQMADAEYKNLRITLNALAEKLRLIHINPRTLSEKNISKSVNILSPIDGFVSKVNVNIGKYVAPTDVLFELINPTDIHLALTVFEKDVNKLFIGQKLVAYTNNDPANKHAGDILLIGKDLSDDRSTEVHCHFDNYDKTLIPGTYMNAEVEVKSNAAWVLPEDAVVRFENKNYVFIKSSVKEFEMLEVQTGITENGFTEILDGETLQQKDLVGKGAYTLLMGLKNKTED
mgnify:CR=1 FL=1